MSFGECTGAESVTRRVEVEACSTYVYKCVIQLSCLFGSLGNNGIGHDGLQYLCRMLKVNKTLKVLK